MSNNIIFIFLVISAAVTAYKLPSDYQAPDECDNSPDGTDYNGGQQPGGGKPDYGYGLKDYLGKPYYYGAAGGRTGGSHYYPKRCPCKKPHKKVDFVFVIKLVKKNYKPPGHRRRNYRSIHTDVLQVCQNDKKKKPKSGRGKRQPMARLETLKNADAGCGPFDGMQEGRCYIVRGYTSKPRNYRYFNIDQCYRPEPVHCGYAKCPHY